MSGPHTQSGSTQVVPRDAPPGTRHDFVIAGAMKSGTTTWHALLAAHPGVFLPPGESQWLSFDEIIENPVCYRFAPTGWSGPPQSPFAPEAVAWQTARFRDAPANACVGEDAPSYLSSTQALPRLTALFPNVRVLVLLRDPVDRLYSHYWHLVKTFRVSRSIEDLLRLSPEVLIRRSLYREQLARARQAAGSGQVHVELFEHFVSDLPGAMRRTLTFLGLEPAPPPAAWAQHHNRGHFPRRPGVAYLRNGWFHRQAGRRYSAHVPGVRPPDPLPLHRRLLLCVLDRLADFRSGKTPPLHPATRDFLAQYFREANAGLDTDLGVDLAAWWPSWRQSHNGPAT